MVRMIPIGLYRPCHPYNIEHGRPFSRMTSLRSPCVTLEDFKPCIPPAVAAAWYNHHCAIVARSVPHPRVSSQSSLGVPRPSAEPPLPVSGGWKRMSAYRRSGRADQENFIAIRYLGRRLRKLFWESGAMYRTLSVNYP